MIRLVILLNEFFYLRKALRLINFNKLRFISFQMTEASQEMRQIYFLLELARYDAFTTTIALISS